MSEYLTIADYEAAEAAAISRMPNRIVQAFRPVHFEGVNYPTRIKHQSELCKYADVMGELEYDLALNKLGGLTTKEFEFLGQMSEMIGEFTESTFGRRMLARNLVLSSLNVLRHIKYLFGDARPHVLEIGPGCGYLGAMLILEGYPYMATEVSQAFYLYQNHLWNFITKGINEKGINETVTEPLDTQNAVCHLPWWEFANLDREAISHVQAVTCNEVLCEMHYNSRGFALAIVPDATFVFSGWGAPLELLTK